MKTLAPLMVAAGLLAGWSVDSPSAQTSVEADTSLATILQQVGENLDACFDGLPAMFDPGARQAAPDVGPRPVKINRLVVAIDSSGSMAASAGTMSKLDAAKRAASAFLSGVPAGTDVGLVVFGHKGSNAASGKAASCAGVDTLYPLGAADPAQVGAAMQRFRATGWTPLAAGITAAGRAFGPSDAARQVVYVVSDGLETCGGDPVAAARALNAGPTKAIVNIIGFDLAAADRAQLRAVAEAGGGTFVETSPSRIGIMLDELQRKVSAVSAITRERFDAGGRTTANNMAAGRYTTKVNMCLYRGTTGERDRVAQALADRQVTPDEREATLAALRERHGAYRARSERIFADLDARRTKANAAIDEQIQQSEKRLGQ